LIYHYQRRSFVLLFALSAFASAFSQDSSKFGQKSNLGQTLHPAHPSKAEAGNAQANRTLGPLFLLGDSYLDDVGNSSYLVYSNPAPYQNSDGPSYGMAVGDSLNQPLASIGRYTPSGQSPHPLGHCYAVSGAVISNNAIVPNYGLSNQVTQLLKDYSGVLPTASIVLINIGINDVDVAVLILSGQWTSADNSSWKVSRNYTLPAAGSTATVPVSSTTGVATGKPISFPISGNPYNNDAIVTSYEANTSISFTVPPGYGGVVVPSGGTITTAAQGFIAFEISNYLSGQLTSLLNAGATIVIASPADVSYLPANSTTVTLTHWTWEMYVYQLNQLLRTVKKNLRLLDLQPVVADIIANPDKYGLKNATTAWDRSSSTSAKDYLFWDQYHLTASGHRIIAGKTLELFNSWGLAPKSHSP
jgi:GDSL-like Lipase/Acylhydrolase